MKSKCTFILYSIFIVLFLAACGKNKETGNQDSKPDPDKDTTLINLSKRSIEEIKLTTETAELKPVSGYLSVPARVAADQDKEAIVGSLVQGRVKSIFAKIGDRVKKGQILMTIEGLEIGEIRSNFMKARANYNYAKSNYDRIKKLNEQNISSQKSLLEAQAEYEKTLAEFNAEDKKIHSIGFSDNDIISGDNLNEDHTGGVLAIKSPIDGIIIERNVVIGQLIETSTNAFRIINTGTLYIFGQIYDKDINIINQKSEVLFRNPDEPERKFSGKIEYIGSVLDEKTRTIPIRANFINHDNILKPQMFGELLIPIGSDLKAIMVPSESIIKEPDKSYIFIQINDTTFEKRGVLTGSNINDMIEIKEGIKPGEKIVKRGAFYLKSELKKDQLGED